VNYVLNTEPRYWAHEQIKIILKDRRDPPRDPDGSLT